MNVLYISRVNPFINGGGAFASRAYIDAFIELSDSFTLMIADNCIVPDSYKQKAGIVYVPERPLKDKLLFPLTGRLHRFIPYIYEYWQQTGKGKFDTVVLNGGVLAGDLVDFFQKEKMKVITIHHNVERQYHKDNRTIESFGGLYAGYINRNEKRALLGSDLNLSISRADMKEFRELYDLPDDVSLEYIGCFENKDRKPVKLLSKPEAHTLIITGSLGDYQTEEGVLHFLEELYPPMLRTYPDIKLLIAGRNPGKKLTKQCRQPNIQLIANPDDMDTLIQQASVYIAPTRLGSGLKLRLMDGLRNGKAILSHPTSAKGYEAFHDKDYFRQYTSAADFAEKLGFLLGHRFDPEKIMNDYRRHFSFRSGVERLEHLLNNK